LLKNENQFKFWRTPGEPLVYAYEVWCYLNLYSVARNFGVSFIFDLLNFNSEASATAIVFLDKVKLELLSRVWV
jgi:hypothetical protein